MLGVLLGDKNLLCKDHWTWPGLSSASPTCPSPEPTHDNWQTEGTLTLNTLLRTSLTNCFRVRLGPAHVLRESNSPCCDVRIVGGSVPPHHETLPLIS